jgi:hypothetical protein
MANSNTPYKRLGVGQNSWEDLLKKVNDELENPPEETDCEPIAPIEVPGPEHRWAKSDVREVHDKLNEMPGNCFSFQPIPDLWKVATIEDIENQLSNSWCDCEEDEICCEPCPNAGETTTTFLLRFDTLGRCRDIGSATCVPRPCEGDNLTPARLEYTTGKSQYETGACGFCAIQKDIDEVEGDIAQLEAQRANCPAGPEGDACRASLDAQIASKQELLDTLLATQQVFTDLRNQGKAKLIQGATNTIAAVDTCIADKTFPPCTDLVEPIGPIPVNAEDCNQLPDPCCDCDPFDCRVTWRLQRKSIRLGGDWNFEGDFRTVANGEYNIEGNPVVFDWTGTCCVQPQYTCGSSDCSGGCQCGGCTWIYEYQLIKNFPREFDAFDCVTFEPCGSAVPPAG